MRDLADIFPGGPRFDADLFAIPGRLARLCKGDGGSAAAEQQARASRKQAQAQHEENMRQLRKQARVAANSSSPEFTPASAPAAVSVDTMEAGQDQRRRALRRFGYTATKSETLGSSSTLG